MAMSGKKNTFVVPTGKQRAEALGETNSLNEDVRRALTVAIDDSFPSIPLPKGGDWLSEHLEEGQTVQQFQRCRKTRPRLSRNVIYTQPIGDFNSPRSPSLEIICEFSHLFFPGCRTEISTRIDFDSKIGKRVNPYTNQIQYRVQDLMARLKTVQRKRHNTQELFSVGVTTADIYPGPRWNFVYGEASVEEGIGLYSFARFDPLFPHSSPETLQRPCTDKERILILKRAVSTFIHEIMHLFGLEHCIYYLCLMNGTNHQDEMDGQLLYLCPICLRKMHLLFGKEQYNVTKMYRGLFELCKKVGFEEEVKWYENRLRILNVNE